MTDLRNRDLTQKRIKNADRKFNTHLKNIAKEIGLTKPLKMHIARHTFGNISGDRIPIQMLQKLYRHTVVTTTIGYQSNFKHKDADEALNQTVGF
jgi:site-specific recombinase XerD